MELQRLVGTMRKAITDYKMIKDGDKIAVGISGGKDSVCLLQMLASYRRYSPEKFDLVAITVDLCFGGKETDFSTIQALCDELAVPYHIVRTQIGEIIFDARKETNPCALCSKMRKGALYDKAVELGANKIALGHHRDDLIDTFMLSTFYEGRLSTFAPKSFLDRTGLTLIRPLLYLAECDITSYASENLPIVINRCPADKNTKRQEIKDIVKSIDQKIPGVRSMLFTALTHPERYNLFDRYKDEIDKI